MKIIILGTSPFTAECIYTFIKSGWNVECIVSMPKKMCPLNSLDLEEVALKNGIIYYETEDINSLKTQNYLQQFDVDYIFSTWPHIIKENILKIPKYCVIGSHPTQLPHNRGRHPLHWMITLGIENSCISLFVMNKGIDSGNILVQEPFSCNYEYGVINVYNNMICATKKAIKQLCLKLEKNPNDNGTVQIQNNEEANYWRKKDLYDMLIDFRMTASDIIKLVKSFNKPYECAVLVYEEYFFRIENAEIWDGISNDDKVKQMEYGKILNVTQHSIIVKAADKIVKLYSDSDFTDVLFGKYIYTPTKYIVRHYNIYKKLI